MDQPRNAKCIITLSFDDGYSETIESAARILEKYDLKATFNIIAGLVGDFSRGFKFASWDDLRDLSAAGNEIASHGMSHLPLDFSIKFRALKFSRLLLSQPTRALRVFKYGTIHPMYTVKNVNIIYELESSKRIIEENIPNYTCVSFAYPGGYYDKKLKLVVKGAGYLSARSTDAGHNSLTDFDPYALKVKKWDYATRVKEANKWVDATCKRSAWLIECLHLIGNDNKRGYPYFTHVDDLKEHLNYLMDRNVWMTTQGNVIRSFQKMLK